jgi:predicted O-linked N-acetylglucosamine transferase (SPINDLY family)
MSAILNRKLKQAYELLREGEPARARSLCDEILRRAPRNAEALYLVGLTHLADGDAERAVPALRQALEAAPGQATAREYLGLAYLMLGRFADAESALTKVVASPNAPPSAFMRLGAAMIEQGRAADAIPILRRGLALDPSSTDCHLNMGRALAQTGDSEGARDQFESVLRIDPANLQAAFNLGVLALQGERLDEAAHCFERVLRASPHYVDALVNLGIVLQKQSRLDRAIERLSEAVALAPANPAARNNLALTFALHGRLEEAHDQYTAALRAAPDHAAAHEGLASVCAALGRVSEAIEHLNATLRAEPENRHALSALAGALFDGGRLDEALEAAQRVIALEPSAAAAYATAANVHIVRGALDKAIAVLEAGYEHTQSSNLLGMLTYQLRHACEWTKWRVAWEKMEPEIERGAALGSPFWLLCEPTTPRQQVEYTRRWAEARFKTARKTRAFAPRARNARLRVGYLSSDLQEHAAAYLITEVLELHDRERVEIFAYSHGPDDGGPMRARLRAACEHFVDIAWEPDDLAAERIRGDALDLLVDLKGYTAGDRLTIMARRPCPVQITWLGYPGTTGAAFMDYLIADAFIIPPGREDMVSERVVRLPHCYQPNDRKRPHAEPLDRRAYGLPEDGFVFCCFNQTFKIAPDVFDVWLRLLRNVPGSVLWLVDSNAQAKRNLIEAAGAQGIVPERLVFAPRLPYAQHLARYAQADLALDTFPYTSHTTLSDALWCGCPTVGLCGETFAGRVSGSLLTTAGLSDLVTCTFENYEALALRLATEHQALQEVRARVFAARDRSPLFDSAAFARDLEKLYGAIACGEHEQAG